MNNHGDFRNGRNRRSSMFPYVGVQGDRGGSYDDFPDDRFADIVSRLDSTPATLTMTTDPEQAEVDAETAVTKDEGRSAAEVDDAGAAGVGPAAGLLALAQKLHDEYVADGQNTRERLIGQGQLRHHQVVGEATARQEELLSTGQAKHDEFVSAGEAKHDALIAEAEALLAEANAEHQRMITEARERSTEMVAEAQQKRAAIFQELGSERHLLQKKIEELRAFERGHRAHLKSYLEGQLVELDQSGADETVCEAG
jgi:hypothetical protein